MSRLVSQHTGLHVCSQKVIFLMATVPLSLNTRTKLPKRKAQSLRRVSCEEKQSYYGKQFLRLCSASTRLEDPVNDSFGTGTILRAKVVFCYQPRNNGQRKVLRFPPFESCLIH